jgi:hypothetical protein
MAYDRSQNLLFIHIPKNAGKSIEHALDIVPKQMIDRPGSLRSSLNGLLKKIHYLTNSRVPAEKLFGPLDIVLCSQHLSYQEIENLRLISAAELESARKFAVVRNPFDRAISVYHMFHSETDIERFKKFWTCEVDQETQDHVRSVFFRPQFSFLCDQFGQLSVEHILRFENLGEEFLDLCSKLNLPVRALEKIGSRKEQSPYRDFYDKEAKKIIERRFHRDLEFFNYTF